MSGPPTQWSAGRPRVIGSRRPPRYPARDAGRPPSLRPRPTHTLLSPGYYCRTRVNPSHLSSPSPSASFPFNTNPSPPDHPDSSHLRGEGDVSSTVRGTRCRTQDPSLLSTGVGGTDPRGGRGPRHNESPVPRRRISSVQTPFPLLPRVSDLTP